MSKARLLLVEGKTVIASNIRDNLESLGYRMHCVSASTDQVYQAVKTDKPDLVLMDTIIEQGMSARKIAGMIRARFQVPVIFLTIGSDKELSQSEKEDDPFGCIAIPFDDRELQITIEMTIYRDKMEKSILEKERKLQNLYKKARYAEQMYRSILRSSADAIAIYDIEGNPTYVNPAFTRIFGWSIDEIRHHRIPFVPESEVERTMQLITELIQNGTPCTDYETKRTTRDGRILDIVISASRYDDLESHPAGMLVILRDISEKKRLEHQLAQARKMEAIGTLAGGIAHDFNNILMGIQGNNALMILECEPTHPFSPRLKNIAKYVQSGAKLTRQLLCFVKGAVIEIKPTDMNELVKKSSELFGRTHKEVVIHLKLQKGIWAVEADRTQIEQVFLNLYVNAAQAMPAGGDLYLETSNVLFDKHDGLPRQTVPGKYVKISVTDTGIGMDEQIKNQIFDPFFTTKSMKRGTGLGLTTVFGIIRNHNGFINVYSEKGSGSTFSIYLPATEKSIQRKTKLSADMIMGNETVLLVDDEEMIQEVGKEILKTLGYQVLQAHGGSEAVDVYSREYHRIDIVILDMIMPDMGGEEVYKQLKTINPKVKVLLSSGFSADGRAEKILQKGCNGFIQKPFSIEELSVKIRSILNQE